MNSVSTFVAIVAGLGTFVFGVTSGYILCLILMSKDSNGR